MNSLEFLQKAVCKEETRYNINKIYRDKNHLVATDGHRLHYCESVNPGAPQFLDGSTGEFPDWQAVLPQYKNPICIKLGSDEWTKQELPKLKALLNISKLISKKECPIYLHIQNETRYKFEVRGDTVTATYLDIDTTQPYNTFKFNLSYFLDGINPISTNFITFENETTPIQIENSIGTAIVMPMRQK